MKKVVYFLSSALVAMFAFTSCGSDDDDSKENKDKVYNVKSITYKNSDGDFDKCTFVYENDKISKVTYTDSDGEMTTLKFTYASASSINVTSDDGSSVVITMDVANNVISKYESSSYDDEESEWHNYSEIFEFEAGKLSSITSGEEHDFYSTILGWENNNITLYDGDEQFIYSDVKNNTNIDFALWLEEESLIYTSQFMKNISNNIPSSYKSSYSGVAVITTTLDEKGRPSKMVFDGDTYTFEYYD